MNKLTIGISTIVLSTVVLYNTQAQTSAYQDSVKKQLDRLLASNLPEDRQLLNERLQTLAGSNKEIDMALSVSYYYQLKNAKASDSVADAEIVKFPNGLQARIKAQQAITTMKNLPEMEKAYRQFIKKFPSGSFPSLPFGEDRLPYDRIRSTLANGYASVKNVAKARQYAGLLEADFWKVYSYGNLADTFYAYGDLANAAIYQQKAQASAAPYAEGKMGNSPAANYASKHYAEACRTYASLLYEQKKHNEALTYIGIAVKVAKAPGAAFYYTYAKILAALNRHQEAYDQIEAVVRSGEATQEMSNLFTTLYIKVKGDTAGLNAYQAAIRKGVLDNLRKRLTQSMVNEPAADFTLTDLQGNLVQLADLKGKIVILDFWATWCVPCKASFPAMQMAIDKYKNDPTIKFLFIHTWERTATPATDARDYIAGKQYNFDVLMDTKDPETKANKVVNSYHVNSIPAKFVIDGTGNIRFKLNGFNNSNEAVVDELTMIIEMIRARG